MTSWSRSLFHKDVTVITSKTKTLEKKIFESLKAKRQNRREAVTQSHGSSVPSGKDSRVTEIKQKSESLQVTGLKAFIFSIRGLNFRKVSSREVGGVLDGSKKCSRSLVHSPAGN